MEATKHERMSTDQLFRHYAPFVSRFLLRLGVAEESVDDAVQEVFLVAHRSGGYLPGPAKPTTYLATIAVHAAAAHRRAQKTCATRSAAHDLDELVAPERDPAEALEARDSLRQLQTALDRLDDNLRVTLLMADGIGQTCPTIASAMNVPLGTVYWRLDRARKLFRVAWKCVGADRAPQRNPDADGSTKRARRSHKAGAWVSWLPGSFGHAEARAWLRASCEPSPAELAFARSAPLPRSLGAADAQQPAWASAVHTAPQASAWLGLGALELSSLSAVAAAAIVVCAYLGVLPSTLPTPRQCPPSAAPLQAARARAASARLDGAALSTALAPLGAASPRPLARSSQPEPVPATLRSPAEQPRASRSPTSAPDATLASSALAAQPRSPEPAPIPAEQRSFTTGARNIGAAKTRLGQSSVGPHTRSVEPAARATANAGSPSTQAQLLEAREVARAERLLASNPHEALRLVSTLGRRVGTDELREERDYIEVIALFRIGRAQDARAASTRFLRTYPESAFAGAIVNTARRLSTDS